MKRIIEAIEAKFEANECKIFVQNHEIEELKRKLAEAEKTIESQAQIISDLKGENA
jgi:uncharacterized coiled-coil protein SlyX